MQLQCLVKICLHLVTSMSEHMGLKSLMNQFPPPFPPWSLILCYPFLTTVTHVGLYSPLLLNFSSFPLPSQLSPALFQVLASFWVTISKVFWNKGILINWKGVGGTRTTVVGFFVGVAHFVSRGRWYFPSPLAPVTTPEIPHSTPATYSWKKLQKERRKKEKSSKSDLEARCILTYAERLN